MTGGQCQRCGTTRGRMHRDHVVPKWAGGPDTPENTQLLCANCHSEKTYAETQTPEYRAMSASSLGKKRSAETRKRLAQLARERGASADYRAKQREAHLGHVVTAETRAKLAAAARQRFEDPARRQRSREMTLERWATPEFRAKILATFPRPAPRPAGWHHTDETKEKLKQRPVRRGWRHTPEARAKIAASLQARAQALRSHDPSWLIEKGLI